MPIDDGLIGGIRIARLTRGESTRDDAHSHLAFQTSTIDALLRGHVRGDLTIGELLSHGNLGIGTIDRLNGELIIVDGEAFVAHADGFVVAVDAATTTPFAVVCSFTEDAAGRLVEAATMDALTEQIDLLAPPEAACVAVRMEVEVARAHLRSVAADDTPDRTVADVLAAQSVFDVFDADAIVVGFRFPRDVEGLEVPGWHLHLITTDRSCGGHVLNLAIRGGRVAIALEDDLHIEVPKGVDPGRVGHDPTRARELRRLERDG